ncbi:uncharacterized protein LOC112459226 [Temnothorax curvispinosus]|uniref:Uncharacterized protein LOC112459226 n=1 Tax=Temnothorax curvispinosus TaxID=300111 RepID=A0A6J1QBE1_9HYME|nr:uncharacterized protein LOC112459226 [Temnothorax curvispinosus]
MSNIKMEEHISVPYDKPNLVTKVDKGQVIVIMDKSTYLSQMTELLSDSFTYKKVNKNPINRITTKIKDLIKNWYDKDIISEMGYKRLNCTNGNLPRCYGLPKVHKNGFPLRIIVSAVGSPLYEIARLLHDTLDQSVPVPHSHVKDSWSFVDMIGGVEIEDDDVLVSLDVTALFTNIPKDLVTIEKRWNHIAEKTKLSLPQFTHTIDLILSSTRFCFNGEFYEQIFGSPMGSPLSPILADLIMDDLETHCLQSLNGIHATGARGQHRW